MEVLVTCIITGVVVGMLVLSSEVAEYGKENGLYKKYSED